MSTTASAPFQFPAGIRFPAPDEIPDGPEKQSTLDRIASAHIESGFILGRSLNQTYDYQMEANVSAPDIWNVFSDLTNAIMPGRLALILGEKGLPDNELYYSPPIERGTMLVLLEPSAFELANDACLQFGLVSHVDGRTDEIFVHPSKYFTVWTSDAVAVRAVMAKYNIPEKEELTFLYEYPRLTLPEYPGRKRDYRQVVTDIQSKFPVFIKK